ncbi:uncharacterized protein LOC143230531 [Tachypleus tridentatus]|uniref:uncharacterized protein LOC143230531 n=1 Tax=Tachypleus tridentatus TaxID=6853 RepID=UPI003FD40297
MDLGHQRVYQTSVSEVDYQHIRGSPSNYIRDEIPTGTGKVKNGTVEIIEDRLFTRTLPLALKIIKLQESEAFKKMNQNRSQEQLGNGQYIKDGFTTVKCLQESQNAFYRFLFCQYLQKDSKLSPERYLFGTCYGLLKCWLRPILPILSRVTLVILQLLF